MFSALIAVQVLLSLAIIGLVLLQQGKGADMGAAFGSGASGSLFGARGGGSFFSRVTGVLAALFFANSLLLSSPLVLGDRHPTESSVTSTLPAAPESDVPPVEEVVDTDVPPADLPEADVAEPAAADDLPAVSDETPAVIEEPADAAPAADETAAEPAPDAGAASEPAADTTPAADDSPDKGSE